MKTSSHVSGAFLLAASLAVCWLPQPVLGIQIGWADGMTIWLGDGVHLHNQGSPAFPGIVQLAPTSSNAKNGWQNEAVSFAQHTHDMVKSLNINSSLKVQSTFGSGSGSMDFYMKQNFSEMDLKFVFVKKRNFGTTLYMPTGFSTQFSQSVSNFQRTLQGQALHAKIANTFGTHYVRGFEKSAFVVVVYTFQFKSASAKRSLNVSASGSAWGSASFSGFASSFFGSTGSALGLNYQLYSSSYNPLPPYLSTGGVITNYQSFTNLVNNLERYVNSMTDADPDAKISGYVLDPIQSVPGYLSLLDGAAPTLPDQGDASDFFQVYSALQLMDQRLTSAATTMSWLNSNGLQLVQSKTLDVRNSLAAMRTIASKHDAIGAPLYVPSDAVTHLASLRDLPIPEPYVMDSFLYDDGTSVDPDWRYVLGRVDCGERELVKDIPFNNLARLRYGTNYGNTVELFYESRRFETNMLNTYTSGTRRLHLTNLFNSAQWACLTNPLTNPRLNGFFLVFNNIPRGQNAYLTPEAAMAVAAKDDRGTNVAVLAQLDTRSGGCGAPRRFSPDAEVSVATAPAPPGVVGLAQSVTAQVANHSPYQTHGTTLSFVLGSDFDFAGGTGSQGFASFNPTNRVVTYSVGPLLGGAVADINLKVVPLHTNAALGTGLALTLGPGLINHSPATNALLTPIESARPSLDLTRGRSGVVLNWRSDSDRMTVERRSTVAPGATWTPLAGEVITDSSTGDRFLAATNSGQSGFFRLHSQ